MKNKFTKVFAVFTLFAVLFGFSAPYASTSTTIKYVKTEPGDSH